MKKIYLVRHCEYSNPRNILVGRLPVALSKNGVKHAERLRKFFSDKHIDIIFSSAVKRCEQTSTIISDAKIPIQFDHRLLETFSAYQGYWGGYKDGELDWTEFFSHRSELGGEGAHAIQARMVDFFADIQKRDEETMLVCSHGDPLYLLYLHLLKRKNISDADIYGELPDYQPKGSIREITWNSATDNTISDFIEI